MNKRGIFGFLLALALLGAPALVQAAAHITDFDSTQPRGFGGPLDQFGNDCASGPVYNDRGQDLCPQVDGMWSPFYYVGNAGQGSQERYFEEWKGMMMGNAARDPAFFATLSVANKDFTNLIYAAAQKGLDTYNQALYDLVGLGTAREVVVHLKLDDPTCSEGGPVVEGVCLLPEEKLPVTADLCLRCHFTAGWLEGRSEPPTPHFPYLKGQFWGTAFQENPGWPGEPQLVDIHSDSEADMEGIQCAFCHRQDDGYPRNSNYDDTLMSNGNGGYFVNKYDPFDNFLVRPSNDFQKGSAFCGTCHDVTNPLIFTKTEGASKMLHPIERTYTEFFWSDFGASGQECTSCHTPMQFQGAQTWLIYPGLDMLWGAVDQKWTEAPYNYNQYFDVITPFRTAAYMEAKTRSDALMQDAARVDVAITHVTAADGFATVEVEVTNDSGHKLPTGFAEGRQMWLHIKAVDERGDVLFEDGVIDGSGKLVRTAETKVYEQIPLAKGYDTFELCEETVTYDKKGRPRTKTVCANILDADKDGTVTHYEKEFHFVLMNYIEKDNRIPPRGFNKAAYLADGAFIVPYGPKDTDYADGQNWDVTSYTFPLVNAKGKPLYRGEITVTAELKYQTFNKEYIDFLAEMDTELTQEHGGRARNVPCNDGSEYCGYETWGKVLQQMWLDTGNGPPVMMATDARSFRP